jgi:hypothetical protein
MRRRRSVSFTVYTVRGRGSYRSYAMADSAARWVAQVTGETVTVVNDGTGESWEVSIARARRSVVSHPHRPPDGGLATTGSGSRRGSTMMPADGPGTTRARTTAAWSAES